MPAVPHVLVGPPVQLDFNGMNAKLTDLRKQAQVWRVPGFNSLPHHTLADHLQKALQDKNSGRQVVADLTQSDRAVLQAYRRYSGGMISGAVMRMDLIARGVLRLQRPRPGQRFSMPAWEQVPTQRLAERLCLLLAAAPGHFGSMSSRSSFQQPDSPLPTMALNPILEEALTPAGPPPWRVEPIREAVSLGQPRGSAEVAFELSQLFGALAGRKPLRMKHGGEISTPGRQALVKAMPLPDDADFPLPDQQCLYFELFCSLGLIKIVREEARLNQENAHKLFGLPTEHQARMWAAAWLRAEGWCDGSGSTAPQGTHPHLGLESALWVRRQILAWALACVAHQGVQWFDLLAFIERLGTDGGNATRFSNSYQSYGRGWKPSFVNPIIPAGLGIEEQWRIRFLQSEGTWFANAIMVTLAALGLTERGRCADPRGSYCFRLTSLGRAVFGAPEVKFSPQATSRFLIVQPNFDVVAYLDRTDAQTLGDLGLSLENPQPALGPVQTLRFTHAAFYRALELGSSFERIRRLLEQASQHALPANVMQTLGDWAARRDSLVIHTKVTLIGFPDTAGRDAFVQAAGGRPCGDRWVIGEPGLLQPAGSLANALMNDHLSSRACCW